jgi:hypothetical protein
MEKSRGPDHQVDQMSQALNRLRATGSLRRFPRQRRGPGGRAADGWRDLRVGTAPWQAGAADGRPSLSRFPPPAST